jgi:hypothetical protein
VKNTAAEMNRQNVLLLSAFRLSLTWLAFLGRQRVEYHHLAENLADRKEALWVMEYGTIIS